MRDADQEKILDYIVIGSGFGGSVSAMRLAEKGYSVAVLEKGKRFRDEDFPRSNWNLRKYVWLPLIRCFGFQRIDIFKEVGILSGVGVGGGSLVYANTHMFPPDRFFRNPVWKHYRDWKKTLLPHYKTARFMLGSTPYKKEYYADRILKEIAVEMKQQKTYAPVDHVGVYFGDIDRATDPYFRGWGPERKGCLECAGCMVGCRHNAKNTLEKNYLFFAEKFGAKVHPETLVTRIEYDEKSRLYHVLTRSSTSWFHRRRVFHARGLVVSAGVLGTMRLLLKMKYSLKTLPRLSERLGENLRTNSESLCAVTATEEKLNHGLAISRVFNPDDHTHIELCKYPDGSGFMSRLMAPAVGDGNAVQRSLKLIAEVFRNPRRLLRFWFQKDFARNSLFFLVMQDLDNAMRMVWKRFPFRRLHISNDGHRRVPAYIDIGQRVMNRFAEKTGGVALNGIMEILGNVSSTAHILGGCPMGETAAEGVVNDRFAVHGYDNMLILDGSIIPCNLGVNPSLTITALGEYAMSKIPAKPGARHITLEKLLRKKAPADAPALPEYR